MNWRHFAALVSFACSASAMFMRPEWVPVDRLIRNTARYVEGHPSEASGYYSLGRLHYLAFTLKMELVPAYPQRDDELARPVPDHLVGLPLAGARQERAMALAREELGDKADSEEERQKFFQAVSRYRAKLEAENWTPPKAAPETLIEHATQAAAAFRKAMELDPKDGLYPLGLGSLLVQFADWVDEARPREIPEAFRGDLRREARGHFLTAWERAYPAESKAKRLPLGGLSQFASFEAAHAFLRLAESDAKSLTAQEKAAVAKMKAGVAAFEKLPMGAITPLVLSVRPVQNFEELLRPNASVDFDLIGFALRQRWTWVSAEAGLIVWDPLDRREIQSGKQLFGNFSFQGIWRTGFDALRALDDNGDGQVAGAELCGVAVWFDRNGDARSTRSEVVPIEELGIRAMQCEPIEMHRGHWVNRSGVIFHDCRTVPLWDWMAQPATITP